MSFKECIEAIKNHEKVMIYDSDDREGEIDIVQPAKHIDYEDIAFMRNYGGGLICVTLPHETTKELGLPLVSELLEKHGFSESKIPYGEKSSFSLWVNHKETFTGITDKDRAKTARELQKNHKKVKEGSKTDFKNQFRFPGHVPILKGAEGLLKNRKGHTELSMALAEKADIDKTMVVCEMLDDETGRALSLADAQELGDEREIPLVRGQKIIDEFH